MPFRPYSRKFFTFYRRLQRESITKCILEQKRKALTQGMPGAVAEEIKIMRTALGRSIFSIF
jgi:hypothetical protein